MRRLAAFAALVLGVSGSLAAAPCPPDGEWATAPVPPAPAGRVVLTVAYAINPRLPAFGADQIERMLGGARRLARSALGVDIVFRPVHRIGIEELARAMRPDVWNAFRAQVYDPAGSSASRPVFEDMTLARIEKQGTTLEAARAFVVPHLPAAATAPTLQALVRLLVQRHLDGLAHWHRTAAADGRPVLGDEPYHQWTWWSALGYGALPYDIVLTNQLVASAEMSGNDIHTMLRGGVAAGTTFFSRQSSRRAYVMSSTFVFSDALAAMTAARGDGKYGPGEAADLAGAYLVHEIGHLLFHLGHPFGNPACVMRPAEMFQFRQWRASLAPARCPLGSEAAMTPGAAIIDYLVRLAEPERCPRP